MDGPLCYIIIRYLFYVTDEYVLQPQSEKNEDHPLNPNPDSQWQSFFKDNDVLLQIDKDVRRLCPDINFFSQATDFPNKKIAGLISFSSNFVTLKVEFFLSIFCKRMPQYAEARCYPKKNVCNKNCLFYPNFFESEVKT